MRYNNPFTPAKMRKAKSRWQVIRRKRIRAGLCLRDAQPLSQTDKDEEHKICESCRAIMRIKIGIKRAEIVL